MLSVAACLFALSTVAFASQRARLPFALASAASTVALVIAELGAMSGIVVALALWMTAASVLVLVLPPRPQLARPIATGCAAIGVLACGLAAMLERVP